jgi:uncharacterized membrane protein YhaH (DUF805 family)
MPTIMQMLFSFEGRMRRRDFWLCALGLAVLQWVVWSIAAAMFFPAVAVNVSPSGNVAVWTSWMGAIAGPMLLINCIFLWPRLAIGVKRCHDRNKTGFWLLLALIPILGWIWLLVDLGFLDGTPGPNKYGPSPKGLGGEAAPAAA